MNEEHQVGLSPSEHTPVMVPEVLQFLDPSKNKNYLDCTIGGGGHAKAILEKTGPNGMVYGIDRDPFALTSSKETLRDESHRLKLFHGKFSDVSDIISPEIFEELHGALIDCGVSSFQLNSDSRGFSFRFNSPLDMRMNPQDSISAADFLHGINETELANVIYQLGDERNSRKIARNIVAARDEGRLETTFDLIEAVERSFPPRHYYKTHPATKTFQAIRMKINDELGEIQRGLEALMSHLPVGAKIVVITFHSLEDRLVKQTFRRAFQEKKVKLLSKKPLMPTREETQENPRARSAKVRGIELISYEE